MKCNNTTSATSAPYFTPDGHVDLDVARQAIDAVAAELGVARGSRRRDLPDACG